MQGMLLTAMRKFLLPWCWTWLRDLLSKQTLESRTAWGGYISIAVGLAMGAFEVFQQVSQGQELNLESTQLVAAGGFILYGWNTIFARVGVKNDTAKVKEEILSTLDHKLNQQTTDITEHAAAQVADVKSAAELALEAAARIEKGAKHGV